MYRILMVDDEPNILTGLTHLIKWDEYGIELAGQASNGIEALEKLSETQADILLTDIRMPEMDGLALIQKLRKEGRGIRCIILSGYDDFEYIKEALKLGIENYLLKPVDREELSATLLDTIEKLEAEKVRNISSQRGMAVFRENVLSRWLMNGMDEDGLKEKAALAGIDISEEFYTAAILRLLTRSGQKWKPAGESSVSAAKSICSRICGGSKSTAVFSPANGDIVLLFGRDNEDDRTEIRDILEKCAKATRDSLPVDVFASIGSVEKGCLNAGRSFSCANELQGYSMILPLNSIADYYEAASASSVLQKGMIDLHDYSRLLATKNKNECLRYIADVFEQIRSVKGVTPNYIQNVAVEILYATLNATRTAARGDGQVEEQDIDLSKALKIDKIDELTAWMSDAVSGILDRQTKKTDNCSPHMKMVLTYINQNFSKDLSIKELSSMFNINPAYLGQLFKSATGELFTNYINGIRVEKAKELLQTTNMKVAEISETVGYPNTNNFYKVFKKLTGVSPTEYR